MSGTLHGFNALSTQGGTVYVSGSGAFTYNPPNGFYGTDTFKYTIISMGGTGSATVSVLVSNVLPSLVDDSYTGNQGIALGVPALGVFANDILNSGTLIGYATATTQAGSVLFGVSGAFTYTPAGGFFSPPVDTFRYTVQNNIGTGTATVSITVNATEAGSPSGTTSSLMAWQRYRSWYRWNRI